MVVAPGALFTGAAQRFTDRSALADGTTYGELDEAVSRVAAAMRSLGLEVGARVGVLSHNRPELIGAWLALERAGLVRVALHSHFEIGVHADMLRRTGARALVFDTRFAAGVQSVTDALADSMIFIGVGADCPRWAIAYDELHARGEAGFAAPEAHEDDPVCIQPTTGTTGPPKPWVVSYRAWTTLVMHNFIHLTDMAPFADEEVNLHVHALQWASGAQTLLPYMLNGARTAVLDDADFNPRAVASAIRDSDATGVLLPGPMLAPVLDAIEGQPGFTHRLRRLVTLFATPELLERATRILGPVWCHAYGSTEQGAPVTRLAARDAASRLASVGRTASPLVELRVVDDAGATVPAGRVGEIAVRSAMSDGCYWDEPELTSDAFGEGRWFRSGDLGCLGEDGFLTYVDRSRDAISTSAGVVYPHEVEAAILRHPSVANCGAVGIGEPGAEEVVVAVALKTDAAGDPEDIAAAAAGLALPAPVRVVLVSELPVVLGGAKVQRDVLRERLIASAA
jgi:acyl-CoA synthetase (AMP-forming)/AMP-acid ligase II